MNKLEKFILHIPLIGLMLILTMMNTHTTEIETVTFEQVKIPIMIQVISIALVFLIAIIG
jgi:uncharacterized integral membrane protein